jgi:photosystem II stability/assembly factor-like uncharacterized protein
MLNASLAITGRSAIMLRTEDIGQIWLVAANKQCWTDHKNLLQFKE